MESTHIHGGVLVLMLTNVAEVCGLSVGTADHSAILRMLCWSNLFLTWCVGRKSISKALQTEDWLEETYWFATYGRLFWLVDEKASLFSVHFFDAEQCRDSFQQPQTCDSPRYCVLFIETDQSHP